MIDLESGLIFRKPSKLVLGRGEPKIGPNVQDVYTGGM